jgi:hypothetical protein
MANAVSDLWGGIKSGVGALGRGVGQFASGLGDFVGMDGQFGLSGPTGQPLPGTPGASAADFSQSMAPIPDVANGAGAPTLSAASFGSGIADAGSSAVDQALAVMGQGAADASRGFDTMGFDFGGGAPAVAPTAPISFGGGAAAPGVAPSATPESDPGFIERLMGRGGEGDWMRNIIPGGMLAYQVWRGNQPIPGVENLRNMAGSLASQSEAGGNMIAQAIQGNLPGPARSAVQQALRAAQTTIRGKYSELGMSGSTAEMQELADAELRSVALRFQIGQQMAQTGLQQVAGNNSLAAQLYAAILSAETQRGSELGDALAAFAGATTR